MAEFDESGILTIPITKSAPQLPTPGAAAWLNQNWPIVALVGAGLLLTLLVKPGGGSGAYD